MPVHERTTPKPTQKYAGRTFSFTGFGDFDGALAPAAKEPAKEKEPAEERQPAGNSRGGRQISRRDEASSGVGLTVNIQLQLPPSTDGEVYDKLFASMAKHFKGLIRPG